MKPKFIYDNEGDIPQTLKSHYVESNGKWVLDIEGAVPKSQLDEFRTNNVKLKQQIEAYGEITPERAKELADKEKDWKGGNAKTKEEIDRLVAERVAEMKTTHTTELKKLQDENASLASAMERHVIDGALTAAAAEFGIRPSAIEDLLARGSRTFRLDEHRKPVAKNEDGTTIYGPTGDPLGVRDFIAALAKQAPHLFDPSTGGGASGGKGGSGGSGPNPWKKESFNLTEQSRMMKESPDQARALAAQAGVRL